MKFKNTSQAAFTIVELMIATLVFSIILVLITTGLVQIGRNYYKGALQARTQDTARNVIDEISRGIQFSGETIKVTTPVGASPPYASAAPGSEYGICINGVGYSYIMDREVTASQHGLVSYQVSGGCGSYTPVGVSTAITQPGAKELLAIGMRVTDIEVIDNSLTNSNNYTYTLKIGIGSGSSDLFTPNTVRNNIRDACKAGQGQEYCSISDLSTTVKKRVE